MSLPQFKSSGDSTPNKDREQQTAPSVLSSRLYINNNNSPTLPSMLKGGFPTTILPVHKIPNDRTENQPMPKRVESPTTNGHSLSMTPLPPVVSTGRTSPLPSMAAWSNPVEKKNNTTNNNTPTTTTSIYNHTRIASPKTKLAPLKTSLEQNGENEHDHNSSQSPILSPASKKKSRRRRSKSPDNKRKKEKETGDPFEFIQEIKQNSNKDVTLEFVYMTYRYFDEYNPYALKIVPHSQVAPNDFFTLSGSGVTHFVNGVADFTPLDQWIREHHCYQKVMQIPLFKRYRMWKAYSMWRRNVRASKMAAARASLKTSLFILHPRICNAILEVQDITHHVKQLRMSDIEDGKTYTLEEFARHQSDESRKFLNKLEEFYVEIRKVVLNACDDSLKIAGFGIVDNAGGEAWTTHTETSWFVTPPSPSRGGTPFMNTNNLNSSSFNHTQSVNDHPMTKSKSTVIMNIPTSKTPLHYAELAAKRNECRRLTNFIKLVDYLLVDTLHVLTLGSVQDILSKIVSLAAATDPKKPMQPKEEEKKISKAMSSLMDFIDSKEKNVPIFRMKILLSGELLRCSPSTDEFTEKLDVVIAQFVDTVVHVDELLTHDDFRPYTQASIDSRADSGEMGEGLDLKVIITEDPHYINGNRAIKQIIIDAYRLVEEISFPQFEAFRQMYIQNLTMNIWNMPQHILTLDYFRSEITKYKSQIVEMESMSTLSHVGILSVDSQTLKETLSPSPVRCLEEIGLFLPKMATQMNEDLLSQLTSAIKTLSSNPRTVEEFVLNLEYLRDVTTHRDRMAVRFKAVTDIYSMMETYQVKIPDEEYALYQTLAPTYNQLKNAITLSESNKDMKMDRFITELSLEVDRLRQQVVEVRNQAQNDMISDPDHNIDDVLDYLNELLQQMEALRAKAASYISYQESFKVPVSRFDEMEETYSDLTLKKLLWQSQHQWYQLTETWKECLFEEIDAESVAQKVQHYTKIVFQVERGLKNRVVPRFKAAVDSFRSILPIVLDLRNPRLRPRHWDRLQEIIGSRALRDKNFTLGMLLELHAIDHRDEIAQISLEATKEGQLEETLKKIESIWGQSEFQILLHGGKEHGSREALYIIGGVDEIISQLEDSQVIISTIKGSRYIGPVKLEVEEWDRQLSLMSETLEAWVSCQRDHMYLEGIFGASDIQRQLPQEYKMFLTVDKSWKEIMRSTKENPNAFQACTTPGLLKTFQTCNTTLERIHKSLEEFLETKRISFPRFYFLSNDELLDILAQTKNPHAVQLHLRKCFDNLYSLEFTSMDLRNVDVMAIVSAEGEKVPLVNNVKARGPVETWLSNVEQAMKTTLQKCMKVAIPEYERTAREQWILEHPAQIVLAVSQIFWCREVTKCLQANSRHALTELLTRCIKQLSNLAELVRGPLDPLQRGSLGALTTIDVHSRDIVESMIEEGISNETDFGWLRQLRYYWVEDSCVVKQAQSSFRYGYEFLGCTPRLVITPLTDRCYMTLTGALHLKLGGAPSGPAGTGKTETTKDLAKALAKQCVVFNCSDGLDYKMMGKFFSGLAQAGAWACFDEFNRIDIEVLSVVAQQVLTIRTALLSNAIRFIFEGKEIRLNPTLGVFITMNIGYAGRSELPDNLKSLFRPVAMMVPDYALIAEIILFSEGFQQARILSQKMVQLYRLSSEQLSQQDHYDFGMRAVKSVLVMAGSLKRSNPQLPEEVVLIRALRDSNIPKFVAADVPLFQGILGDLFPGIVLPDHDYGKLYSAIEMSLINMGYQSNPSLITKAIQLYETMQVRHGVMLVGGTAGGKTTCYRALASALTYLANNRKDPSDNVFRKVNTYVLNPKCLSRGELYGQSNPTTQEWTDGLAADTVRRCVNDTSDCLKWVIFDGPVDALWIENMNTVLDDNKTLCLTNGERIKLSPSLTMLFEVENLAVASPATVSRCGMVYIQPKEVVTWREVVLSWLPSLIAPAPQPEEETKPTENKTENAPKSENSNPPNNAEPANEIQSSENLPPVPHPLENHLLRLLTMFDEYVPQSLRYLRANCTEAIPTVDLQLVESLCVLFSALVKGVDFAMLDERQGKILINHLFVFSFVWSIGGNVEGKSQESFDSMVRGLFENLVPLPPTGLLFDYYIDIQERGFRPWKDMVPTFQYSRDLPYFSMIVPTTDTVRYSFLLDTLVRVGRPVLFNGPTGVGKTIIVNNIISDLSDTTTTKKENNAATTSEESDEEKPVIEEKHEEPKPNPGKIFSPVILNFSAQTSSLRTQQIIESKLEKKKKTLSGAPPGKKIFLFIDDINMPALDDYGAQPTIELLRQYLDFKGFYDRKFLFWKDIQDVNLVAACAPPGGGRNHMTPRFTRHFSMLYIPPPNEATLKSIFGAIMSGYLDGAIPEVRVLDKAIINASVELYTRITKELLPVPSKSHYTFNLRDLSKLFQGVLQVKSSAISSSASFVKLWCHESMRVFRDRLIDKADRKYFARLLSELVKRHFELNWGPAQIANPNSPIIFGDFLRPHVPGLERPYEEISDLSKIVTVFEDYQDDYNLDNHSSQLQLIFFMDAVEHVSRISRIIRQPRGNALLVGVGGSGKQSLTRLACNMSGYTLFELEMNKAYGIAEFREDLKKLYQMAGVDGKPVVFLLSGANIVKEAFLEDLNNILNSGEVPNLLEPDEMDKIISDIAPLARVAGVPDSRELIYQYFLERVKENLHIVLCMSPVGDTLRTRFRMFPSLVNCCTIDWFNEWPRNALLSVSNRYLSHPSRQSNFVSDLNQEDLIQNLAEVCVEVHASVSSAAEEYFQKSRRYYYTTPATYLELLALFSDMMRTKRAELVAERDKLKSGLKKLEDTNVVVGLMQKELSQLQPELEQKAHDTEKLLEQITKDTNIANSVRQVVVEEEAIITEKTEKIAIMTDEAQRDLDQALPALEAAIKSLNSLNRNDITEIKSFGKPPELVKTVMEAVLVLLQSKTTDWATAKAFLSEPNFLQTLISFDKDHIPEKVLKNLKKFIENPQFQPDIVAKQSVAARSLCMWVRCIQIYSEVYKSVEPKRLRLAEAQTMLAEAQAKLLDKREKLSEVETQLAALTTRYQKSLYDKTILSQRIDDTTTRINRASKLTSGLSEERIRWQNSLTLLEQSLENIVGDVFLSAACVAYLGAFTRDYRLHLVSKWDQLCRSKNIPLSPAFSLVSMMGNPVTIKDWTMWGLPTDLHSIENGILSTNGRRWPLLIDPQGQANRWIKNMEGAHGLRVVRLNDPNLMRTLENSMRIGSSVLIEEVGETLDSALEPILLKQTFKQGGRLMIRLGDSDVDYEPSFKLFLTTKLANPHYLPEVFIKVNVVNCTVTPLGLEDQLLGDVVAKEQPVVEERRAALITRIAAHKRQLKELEEKILRLLYTSEGNILDDEALINALRDSKATAISVQTKLEESEETERSINLLREQYRPVAIRGSILYFVVADLPLIDPMYQYSLAYFSAIFNNCILITQKSLVLEERLQTLIISITRSVFRNVSRGLLEKDKTIFSFLIGVQVLRQKNEITNHEWNFLLRGTPYAQMVVTSIENSKNENVESEETESSEQNSEVDDLLSYGYIVDSMIPPPWLTSSMWSLCFSLEKMLPHAFKGLTIDLQHVNENGWKEWYFSADPHNTPLPSRWESFLTNFQKLLILKIFYEEKLLFGITGFIEATLGKEFIENPPLDLSKAFKDTSPSIPLIFVLSQGADPTSNLLRYAQEMGKEERLHIISLGQGQGPVAAQLISKATKNGDWVMLQNCHLAVSWMPTLEKIVAGLNITGNLGSNANNSNNSALEISEIHKDFRLILSSMPTSSFPISVLQNGVKLTNEAPKGIRANLMRSFAGISDQLFEHGGGDKIKAWKKLLMALSFFHAIILERKKFGPLGWNIRYEFNESDFQVSMEVIRLFFEEQQTIPWDALRYIVGEISYGGRVADEWDRRCIQAILRRYFSPSLLEDNFTFSSSGIYYPPSPDFDIVGYREYIEKLPFTEKPEVFGMNTNAELSYQSQETSRILNTVLTVQPRMITNVGAKSNDEIIKELAISILNSLPNNLNVDEEGFPGLLEQDSLGRINSLSTVVVQECWRFNKLLDVLRTTLVDLDQALRGLVVMSSDLEKMYNSLLDGRVPQVWAIAAYPSLKPLTSWIEDLKKRIEFMRKWLSTGHPACYWMSGLFFPQGFLTGVLQTHARKHNIPIDSLSFTFEVRDDLHESTITKPPSDGVYIYGLFMDGARWNTESHLLADTLPNETFSKFPVLHLLPKEKTSISPYDYQCPIYKTSARAGTLSTTGHSTNYIITAQLHTDKDPNYWVLRGIALLCQQDS